MRTSSIVGFVVALVATLVAAPAAAQMFKCTAKDGTVVYQARPCGAGDREATVTNGQTADAAGRPATPTRDAQERAIFERDLAQRRARCTTYRDTIERQKTLLDSPNDVTRQHAANEVKNQERRMKDDGCASLGISAT